MNRLVLESKHRVTRRVGIVRGRTLLADVVASSVDEHARFGGVVPEIASRAHLEAMTPTVTRACADAGVALSDIDAIAVTGDRGWSAHYSLERPAHKRCRGRWTSRCLRSTIWQHTLQLINP